MLSKYTFLPATLLFVGSARAANDWSTACLGGYCDYEVTNGPAVGKLSVYGSVKALSDITPAAGWTILSCDTSAGGQDVRAVCTADSATCGHLYQGGAIGTLVRLPESCGKMPFARVADEWQHEDQSVPAEVAAALSRRDSTGSVRGLRLDTNFAAVDASKNGPVKFFIQGTSVPGASGNFTITPPTGVSRRDGTIPNTLEALSKRFDWSDSDSKSFDIDKPFTLFDQSVSCPAAGKIPAFNAELKIAVEAKAHADVTYGIAAVGSVFPPELDEFGLFANFDATLDGILTVDATASASFSTGNVQIFEADIPALDYPGILYIGPSFVVNAQATGSINANVDLSVDLSYSVNNGKLTFPPDQGSSSGVFAPGSSALTLSAAPNAAASGSLSAHITPAVSFGVEAFEGIGEANINLNLDASGSLTLSLNAAGSASTGTGGSSASGSFSGCVDVSTGIDLSAGADGSFLGLFDKSTSVTLYQKNFDLFNKCFGSTKRSESVQSRSHARDVVRRGLACPSSGSTTLAPLQ